MDEQYFTNGQSLILYTSIILAEIGASVANGTRCLLLICSLL